MRAKADATLDATTRPGLGSIKPLIHAFCHPLLEALQHFGRFLSFGFTTAPSRSLWRTESLRSIVSVLSQWLEKLPMATGRRTSGLYREATRRAVKPKASKGLIGRPAKGRSTLDEIGLPQSLQGLTLDPRLSRSRWVGPSVGDPQASGCPGPYSKLKPDETPPDALLLPPKSIQKQAKGLECSGGPANVLPHWTKVRRWSAPPGT